MFEATKSSLAVDVPEDVKEVEMHLENIIYFNEKI